MARVGYRIFDADTHIIEPVEPIEEYLTAVERSKLAALGIGKGPALNRRLGSRERIKPPSAAARAARDAARGHP